MRLTHCTGADGCLRKHSISCFEGNMKNRHIATNRSGLESKAQLEKSGGQNSTHRVNLLYMLPLGASVSLVGMKATLFGAF